jgi:omega-6 fatty acid desaturase (delta-12 desaturase)
MYWSLNFSYVFTILLAVPTGALLVRIFIIQHDCGHGSFFEPRWANNVVGTLCSVLTLVPYSNWKRQHAQHHASWNNLDRRDTGHDIYSACLTVAEYHGKTRLQRFLYRLPRHPIIAHVLLPPLVFLILYRVPFDTPSTWAKERRAVYWLDAMLAASFVLLAMAVGVVPVAMVQLPVMIVASIIGVWLFAVQHRFEKSRWSRQGQWSFKRAALEGSSFLKLPKILQWFTGNIGFHNLHHLAPRIPNYRLERCYRSVDGLQEKFPLTLRSSLSAMKLTLWDEDRQCLVRFKDA